VRQYQGQNLDFTAVTLDAQMQVPKTLFDSVADNLLQNALAKRAAAGGDLRIRISLECGKGPELRVQDSGKAVPAEVVSTLLRGPVRSSTGLGIGLYQAGRLAEKSGYALTLAENRDGSVCFALAPAAA